MTPHEKSEGRRYFYFSPLSWVALHTMYFPYFVWKATHAFHFLPPHRKPTSQDSAWGNLNWLINLWKFSSMEPKARCPSPLYHALFLFLTSMFYSLRSLPAISLPNPVTAVIILLKLLTVRYYLLTLFFSQSLSPALHNSMASCFLSHCSHTCCFYWQSDAGRSTKILI